MRDDPTRVGLPELCRNLSVDLSRVKDGETLPVTEHGRVGARVPAGAENRDALDRLVTGGRTTPPTDDLHAYLATHRPLPLATGQTGTEILLAMREEDADR